MSLSIEKILSVFIILLLSVLSGCAQLKKTGMKPQEELSIDDQISSYSISKTSNPYLSDPPKVPTQAAKDFGAALVYLKKGDLDQAQQYFEQLVKDYPNLSGAYLNLGIIYNEKEDPKAAIEWLRKGIEINPKNVELYNRLGVIYREQGEFKTSEKIYKQGLEVWQSYDKLYLNLGILYELYMGRMQEALSAYERYQSLQEEKDKKVSQWIADLRRRVKQ